MKRGFLNTVFILVFIMVVGVAICALRAQEPVYQGKNLREWLPELDGGRWPRLGAVPVDEAIRNMGTNSFLIIEELLRARDSPLKSRLIKLLNKQSFLRLNITPAGTRQFRAIAACYALGTLAKPLIPTMAEALNSMDQPCQAF